MSWLGGNFSFDVVSVNTLQKATPQEKLTWSTTKRMTAVSSRHDVHEWKETIKETFPLKSQENPIWAYRETFFHLTKKVVTLIVHWKLFASHCSFTVLAPI